MLHVINYMWNLKYDTNEVSMKQNHVHGEQAGVAKAGGEGKGVEGDG